MANALTKWLSKSYAGVHITAYNVVYETSAGIVIDGTFDGEERQKLAARLIAGQFSMEDVRLHRLAALGISQTIRDMRDAAMEHGAEVAAFQNATAELTSRVKWHESMAKRIESLLPTEET